MARAWEQRQISDARQQATVALMDAAERLLYEVGYAGVTTRAVAEAAGVNHGLVHYYFGSMDELLTQTLQRFVDQLADALEALYAEPNLTFAEKWRLGARFWVDEPTSRFPKILLELLAMGWNKPNCESVSPRCTRGFAASSRTISAKPCVSTGSTRLSSR